MFWNKLLRNSVGSFLRWEKGLNLESQLLQKYHAIAYEEKRQDSLAVRDVAHSPVHGEGHAVVALLHVVAAVRKTYRSVGPRARNNPVRNRVSLYVYGMVWYGKVWYGMGPRARNNPARNKGSHFLCILCCVMLRYGMVWYLSLIHI